MQDFNHEKVKEAFEKVKKDFSEIHRTISKTTHAVESLQTTIVENKKELETNISSVQKQANQHLSSYQNLVSKRFDIVSNMQKKHTQANKIELAELEKRVLAVFNNAENKQSVDHKSALQGIQTNRQDISQIDKNVLAVKIQVERVSEKDVRNEKYLKTIIKREDRLETNNLKATRLVQSLQKQKDITLQNRKDVGRITTAQLRLEKKQEETFRDVEAMKKENTVATKDAAHALETVDTKHSTSIKELQKNEKDKKEVAGKQVAAFEKHVQTHKKIHTAQEEFITSHTKTHKDVNTTLTQLEKRIASLEKRSQEVKVVKSNSKPAKVTNSKAVVKETPKKKKNGKGFLFNLFFEEVKEAPHDSKSKPVKKKQTPKTKKVTQK